MEVARPTADFKLSDWGYFFVDYSLSTDQKPGIEQRVEELKKEVKAMFGSNDLAKRLILVDNLQRLGIYYHFEEEIDAAIRWIHDTDDDDIDDVRLVALRFRLLRHEGYAVSPGVFSKFKDRVGEFKQELSCDVEGLMQLYEASKLGTPEEELIDEASEFARVRLERIVAHKKDDPCAAQIRRALETPFHRGMRRLEARHYISVYQKKSKACDSVLLELAKLDFNLLQSLHQEEMKSFLVWRKELGLFDKLSFFRDRGVESYFWSLGVCFEPRYSRGRLFMAKLVYLTTVIDDMCDSYGTLDELQLFTDVIERWELQETDGLPEYMRIFLNSFIGFVAEIDEELRKKGRLHHMRYIVESFKPLVRAYYDEAVMTSKRHTPNLEEYLSIALTSCALPMLINVSLCLMEEDLCKNTLDWMLTMPNIVKASSVVGRLRNDIVSSEFEQQRVHLASSLQIYMKDAGVTEREAIVKLNEMVENAWKEINKECLDPLPSRKHLNLLALNFTRMNEVVYKHEDSYTYPLGHMKENIAMLLVHPVQD